MEKEKPRPYNNFVNIPWPGLKHNTNYIVVHCPSIVEYENNIMA